MQLKLDDKGNAVLTDGKPTYVKDDGTEIAFDGAQAFAKIGQLTGENTEYKRRFTAAETSLKAFEGIEDAEAAKAALVTVANIKDGELISAGKAEELKASTLKAANEAIETAKKAYQADLATANARAETLQGHLDKELIGGAFARSKFVAEKVSTPPHMLEKTYGAHFKVEDGKLIPRDAAGNPMPSSRNIGEVADFDEAIEKVIMADPYKDRILKGTGNSGSNAQPNSGGANLGDTSALSPQQKMNAGRPAVAARR